MLFNFNIFLVIEYFTHDAIEVHSNNAAQATLVAIEDLTIKKLTSGNETMTNMFDELNNK